MFGKKTANGYSEEKDLQLLMQAMDGVIGGNYEDIDTSAFQNPAYGEKFNELIHAYKRSNNNFVMRLNQAMGSIGDNSYVKKTLDQVQSQTESIRDIKDAIRQANISNQDTVLDIGAGKGFLTVHLLKIANNHVASVDLYSHGSLFVADSEFA